MHNPKFVRQNETHKLLWDLEIETVQLISARRSDLIIIKKKRKKKKEKKKGNLQKYGLCFPGRPQSKVERKRKEG